MGGKVITGLLQFCRNELFPNSGNLGKLRAYLKAVPVNFCFMAVVV